MGGETYNPRTRIDFTKAAPMPFRPELILSFCIEV